MIKHGLAVAYHLTWTYFFLDVFRHVGFSRGFKRAHIGPRVGQMPSLPSLRPGVHWVHWASRVADARTEQKQCVTESSPPVSVQHENSIYTSVTSVTGSVTYVMYHRIIDES